MYIDLNRTDTKIKAVVGDVVNEDYITIQNNSTEQSFIFGTNVGISYTSPQKASGLISFYNNLCPTEGNAIIINASNPFAVLYSENSGVCGLKLEDNVEGTEIVLSYLGEEIKFYIGENPLPDYHQVNLGNNLIITANNLASRINYYIYSLGLQATAYGSSIIIKTISSASVVTGNKSSRGSVSITSVPLVGYTVSFNSISYVFGNGVDTSTTIYIPIGQDESICATNLALAINRSLKNNVLSGSAYAVDTTVYIYNALAGELGNVAITSSGGSFYCTNFSGGTSSGMTCSTNNGNSLLVVTAGIDRVEDALASTVIALVSKNPIYTSYVENDDCIVVARYAGLYNNVVTSYGNNIVASNIENGSDPKVDKEETADNLRSAIIDSGIVDQVEITDSILTLYGTNVSITSSPSITLIYTEGSEQEPMSWTEVINYLDSHSLYNIDLILLGGSLAGKGTLSFEGTNFNGGSINVSSRGIVSFGAGYPIYIDGCSNVKVNITGKFESIESGISALVNVNNTINCSITVSNLEYTMKNGDAFLVDTTNCSLNSTLTVTNSTHTIHSNVLGQVEGIYKLGGNVVATSKYNVFCKNSSFETQVAYAYLVGTGCSITSKDVYGRMKRNISYNNNFFDSRIVCDCDNENEYSLNLLADSPALAFDWGSCSPDIRGNTRGFTTQYGKVRVVFSTIPGQTTIHVSALDYVVIGTYKEYLVEEDSYLNVEELVTIISDKFFVSTPLNIVVTGTDRFEIVGEIVSFQTTLSNHVTLSTFVCGSGMSNSSVNVIDAGSRQKNTKVDYKYYVKLDAVTAGIGTSSSPFTLTQMIESIKHSFPLYGNITYELYGENATEVLIDISETISEGSIPALCYGNIHIKGNNIGLHYVPILKANIKASGEGALITSIENVVLSSSSYCLEGDEYYSGSILRVVNSVLKSDSTSVINANYSKLHLIESTIVKTPNSVGGVLSNGKVKSCGCIYSTGDNAIVVSTTSLNTVVAYYNYMVGTNVSIDAQTVKSVGNEHNGVQCLTDPYNATLSVLNFSLLPDSSAVDFIPSVENLQSFCSSLYDIGGRLRASEQIKVTLDAGAVEYHTVLPRERVINVNLALVEPSGDGSIIPTSLEKAYEIIQSMSIIDVPVKVLLHGYGYNKPCLILNSLFTDSGSLSFYGEPNTVLDCFGFINASGVGTKISIRSVALRSLGGTLIENTSIDSITNISSSLLISTDGSDIVNCSGELNAFGNTFASVNSISVKNDGASTIVGNVFAASEEIATTSLTGTNIILENVSMNCTDIGTDYVDLISLQSINDTSINIPDFKLLVETNEVAIDSIPEEVVYKGIELGWKEDIKGNARSLDVGYVVNPGCYDLTAISNKSAYSDEPNGQFAKITEEGHSLITRMLAGNLKFKLSGYSLDKGGYDYINPVNSIPFNEEVQRKTITLLLNSNDFNDGDVISIAGTDIICGVDFFKKATIHLTKLSLEQAINKKSFVVYAVASNEEESIQLTALLPGSISNTIEVVGNNMQITYGADVQDTPYEVQRALPVGGLRTFDHIEYLPLAISLFLRINRDELSSSIGQTIIYATIVDSTVESELHKVIPFAVVRHGMITKDDRTILIERVVIQI